MLNCYQSLAIKSQNYQSSSPSDMSRSLRHRLEPEIVTNESKIYFTSEIFIVNLFKKIFLNKSIEISLISQNKLNIFRKLLKR